jgi:hypothetical protein
MQLQEIQKHKIKCIKIPTVNTRIKMQHQLLATKHKIHVHQILEIAILDFRMQECTMLQMHYHKLYTQWWSYLEAITNKLDGGDNYLLELGGLESSLVVVHWHSS